MAEYLSMAEAEDRFGKKGTAQTALGLGIAGTALSVLNGGLLGGIFGGNSSASCPTNPDSQACAFVNKDTFWRQNVELEKELGVQRYDNLKANYDLYITLDNKISALATKQAQYDAALPLTFQIAKLESERYADGLNAKTDKQMCLGFMGVEAQMSKKIDGSLKLGWDQLYTGMPKLCDVSLDCTCGKV